MSLEFHNVLSCIRWQLHFVLRAQVCHGFGDGNKSWPEWPEGHCQALVILTIAIFVRRVVTSRHLIERRPGSSSSAGRALRL